MSQYAVYIRTKEGDIERTKNVICGFPNFLQAPYGSLAPYFHEEPLEGFPEPIVLWARSTGPTVASGRWTAARILATRIPLHRTPHGIQAAPSIPERPPGSGL